MNLISDLVLTTSPLWEGIVYAYACNHVFALLMYACVFFSLHLSNIIKNLFIWIKTIYQYSVEEKKKTPTIVNKARHLKCFVSYIILLNKSTFLLDNVLHFTPVVLIMVLIACRKGLIHSPNPRRRYDIFYFNFLLISSWFVCHGISIFQVMC